MATPIPELSPDELSELLTAYMPEIPGYRVIRRLGEGGMSYVYLGVQESLDRQVAIKVISPTALKDEISKLRFEREARTIAKLQHPAIVSIHDVGRTELGLLYFVMPYLPRGHLGQLDLREDEPRLLAILRALLWGLDYAHSRGVVHRDIKPDNVLLDNVDRPLLADFGIALQRTDRSRVTEGGFALGSATHMAPEQARGEKVDSRADLYSIGVLAFEKLVGELPFQAEGPLQMAVRHSVDPVPRLPAAKAHWQPFIDRAMAKTPEARFASAQEMMVALDRFELERAAALASQTSAAEPPAPRPAPVRGIGGRPGFIAVSACVVLVLAIVVAMKAWTPNEAVKPAQLAASPTAAVTTAAVASMEAPERAASDAALQSPATAGAALQAPEAAAAATAGESAELTVEETAAEQQARLAEAALPAETRALRAAARQIMRRRLTQPAGDNALESLLLAHRLAPAEPQLEKLGEAWLVAVQPYISQAFAAESMPSELRLYEAAQELSSRLGLRQGAGWKSVESVPIGWLRGRLRSALQAKDLARLRAVKAEAATLGVAGTALQPEWSQPILSARLGDRLPGTTAMLLLAMPAQGRAGLAAMPKPVSRAEFASFVEATGHAASSCRVRSAVFNLRKRRWNAPGFEQAQADPVVCVSLKDAVAYAGWRSERDQQNYRLASSGEWSALIASAQSRRCEAQPSTCTGTEHVREWTAPCGASCERQPVQGFGWREAEASARAREAAVDAEHGYDDVGFRLVREVAGNEIEQR